MARLSDSLPMTPDGDGKRVNLPAASQPFDVSSLFRATTHSAAHPEASLASSLYKRAEIPLSFALGSVLASEIQRNQPNLPTAIISQSQPLFRSALGLSSVGTSVPGAIPLPASVGGRALAQSLFREQSAAFPESRTVPTSLGLNLSLGALGASSSSSASAQLAETQRMSGIMASMFRDPAAESSSGADGKAGWRSDAHIRPTSTCHCST